MKLLSVLRMGLLPGLVLRQISLCLSVSAPLAVAMPRRSSVVLAPPLVLCLLSTSTLSRSPNTYPPTGHRKTIHRASATLSDRRRQTRVSIYLARTRRMHNSATLLNGAGGSFFAVEWTTPEPLLHPSLPPSIHPSDKHARSLSLWAKV